MPDTPPNQPDRAPRDPHARPTEQPGADRPIDGDPSLHPRGVPSEDLARLFGRRATAAALGEQPGDQVGPYRLLSILGEGGFGVVWLAERRQPFVQRVAIKIIKAGMDSARVVSRFEQERQALAVMDHPCIARVIDGGVTPPAMGARPYFVMEYVKGEPITAYCDRQRLTIRERLQLFVPVCEAVQHAHTKGIIHRDLKPSNILVEINDQRPAAKIIDFGVARAVNRTLTEQTIYTEQGQLIGTPEYMSPEQAEMSATDIDTRTDVYSLGVTLYELLTGALPFDGERMRSAGLIEIQRIIRETEPPRPSTRLSTLGEHVVEVARRRQAQREDLARQLRGELEWIPLKAMRKDRTQRYRTAAEMADDIRRYLDGRPLIAAPESATYRLRKFIRRNRTAALAVGAVAIALVAGFITTAWQAIEARRAADLASAAAESARAEARHRLAAEQEAESRRAAAVAAEQRATIEARKSAAVADFLTRMFESADPNVARGRDITVREILDQAAQRVEREFESEPEVKASLLLTIADAYANLGRADPARRLYQAARELGRRLHDPPTEFDAEAALGLAGVTDDHRIAESLQREAYEIYRRTRGESDPLTNRVLANLSQYAGLLGDETRQEQQYFAAAAMMRGGGMTPAQLKAELVEHVNRTEALWAAGRHDEAVEFVDSTLQPYRDRGLARFLPDSTAMFAAILAQRGYKGTPRASVIVAEREARRVFGDLHTETLDVLRGCTEAMFHANDTAAESEFAARALELARQLKLAESTFASQIARTLEAFIRAGRFDEAEPLLVEFVPICDSAGPSGPGLARLHLAAIHLARGRSSAAEADARTAYSQLLEHLGDADRLTRDAAALLARVLTQTGRATEAAEWAARAAPPPPAPRSAPGPATPPASGP